MLIYFDNCCLHRPLDDKTQPRVKLESEAVLAILGMCESGAANLISSEVLELELDQNPDPQRRAYVAGILAIAAEFIAVDDQISDRAKELELAGFKAMDALHLACAESAHVDYFCSCDDRLLRRAKGMPSLSIKVVAPLELAEEITK